MKISIPHNLDYRDYQKHLVSFLRNWWKRWVAVWHRRAWKDKTFFNILVEMAIKEVWWYAYILPTYAQGKKIIWDSIDKNWLRFKDHIPKEILIWENGTELKFTLSNGSFIQILWSDTIDSIRWISPRGIIFSEYAFQNPTAWEVMRPILAENGWWAIFNSTPNGKNHFYDLCNMAKDNKEWFYQLLTVEDTKAVSKEYIEQERQQWMSEEMIQQEYYCSFEVWAIWSYYAQQIQQAHEEWRITQLPFYKDTPIDLYFDLWVNDSFTISFKQDDWQFFNFINYYEDNWKTLDFYFWIIDDFIERKKGKLWLIYLPHDANQKSHWFLVSGKTIIEKFKDKYWDKVVLIPNKVSVNDWIQEWRKIFPKVRFDKDACSQFIRCLENYKKDWDDVKKVFRDTPKHDWASHWADNFRYFATAPQKYIWQSNTNDIIEVDYNDVL